MLLVPKSNRLLLHVTYCETKVTRYCYIYNITFLLHLFYLIQVHKHATRQIRHYDGNQTALMVQYIKNACN